VNARCALYLRSSKDRADVSIDAQRRELTALAAGKGLAVAAEYADAVERADNWQRPGFAQLLLALSDAGRGWDALLVLDASRLARDDELLAATFRHECKKRGVTIVYAKFPSINPMTDLMVQTVDQLMARMHSMMSREKGLAGMAENVRRGWRAGGRAPLGYRLAPVPTGALRDGQPVNKTRLELTDRAPAMASYLKARAAGLPAHQAAREAGLAVSPSTLVGLEWQALTYAGHTVWNMHHSRGATSGAYTAGTKRRPREDWIIQRGTHEAVITDDEAERILGRLLERRTTRLRGDAYLFSGILAAPGGKRWHGDQGFYRCGRRRVTAAKLETQLIAKIAEDLASDTFVRHCAAAARTAAKPARREAELRVRRRRLDELERQLGRVRNLLPQMEHPEALLPKLDELEKEKRTLEQETVAIANELAGGKVLAMITEDDVRAVLGSLAEGLAGAERPWLKARLRALLDGIVLDPGDLSCRLDYSFRPLSGFSVASPRSAAAIPAIRIRRHLTLYGFRKAA
jgi:DNA invertase Pin-like site-specific DNA recombinase